MARKKKEEKIVLEKSDNILLGNMDEKKVKEDLEKYVDEKINKVFIDELDKANRKLLREKSRKIFVKNIVIIVLLLIIGFLLYLLYTNNYFDRFFNNKNNVIEENNDVIKEEKKEEVKEEKKPTLAELKKEYSYLLDNYVVSDKCNYLNDLYKGNLTNNLKNYYTLNSFDFDSLKKEDDYQIILNDTFKNQYLKLFNDNYSTTNFDYNGNNIRYINMISSYMTTSLLKKEESLIKREIADIKEEDGKILITTVEGFVKDNKIYNIMSNNEVNDYDENSLIKYADDLNRVVYIFENNKLIDFGK